MIDATSLPPFTSRTRESAYAMHGSMPTTKSSPIQIPQKIRPTILPVSSPFSQAMSPEMIFEMSPITSESPTHTPISFGNNSPSNDAFVYSLPIFSSPKRFGNTEFNQRYRTSGWNSRVLASLDGAGSQMANHLLVQPRHCWLDDQDLCPDSPIRQTRTTKITGFLPMKMDTIDTQLGDENVQLERLSPGPRRSSYTSSPWILPGKGGAEEDVAYSQADPNAFEYKRQLLRRIENQNRPRFSVLRSYM